MKSFNPHIRKISLIFPPSTSTLSFEPMVATPMGIAYLGAVLRDSGYEVSCLDAVVEAPYQMTQEGENIGRFGLNYDRIMEWVEKEKPDVVGISCIFSNQWPSTRELTRRIKDLDRDIIVVTGGTHPSFLTERCMKDADLDFVVLSEGEYSFRDLLDRLKNEKPYDDIDGLAYREDGGVHINPKTRLIENLDELPFPARDLLPMEKYFKVALPMGYIFLSNRNTPIFTSRGCTCKCTFCSSANHWMNRYRMHSPEYVLAEIDHLVKDFGVKELKFQDDNFTLNRKRAKKIFEGMIERDWHVYWSTPNGIAIWTLDEEMLKLMRKSGCFHLTLAIESGNQEVLDNLIKKPLKLEKVREVSEISRKLGIDRIAYLIIGLPGETRAQIQDTVDFARSLKLESYVLFIYNPLPGSELYQTCIEKGYIREDDFFEGGGNQYFTSVLDSEEWTAGELERLIRKEWFQNYWSFFRSPYLMGRRWVKFIWHRPSILALFFVRLFRVIKLFIRNIFPETTRPVPKESTRSANPGGECRVMEKKWTYEKLAKSDPETLEQVMRQGTTPDFSDLVGWEFRGFNQPNITGVLGFQKFKKGFFVPPGRAPEGPEVMGYNVPVVQNGLYGKWIALPDEDRPKRFGFYRVYKVRLNEVDNKYPQALLLNYGIPRNGLNPARLLRDSLVQVNPDNPDLFLGEAKFAIGGLRLFPSHFVLERYNKVNDTVR